MMVRDCRSAPRGAPRKLYKSRCRRSMLREARCQETPSGMNAVNATPPVPVVRLAHLSDIHITAPRLGWSRPDWFTKRLPGWINYRWLGRRRRFHLADEVLMMAIAEVRQRRPDQLIFS